MLCFDLRAFTTTRDIFLIRDRFRRAQRSSTLANLVKRFLHRGSHLFDEECAIYRPRSSTRGWHKRSRSRSIEKHPDDASTILPSDNSPNVRVRELSRRHITGKVVPRKRDITHATIRGSVAQCRECPRGPNHRCAAIASRLTTFTQTASSAGDRSSARIPRAWLTRDVAARRASGRAGPRRNRAPRSCQATTARTFAFESYRDVTSPGKVVPRKRDITHATIRGSVAQCRVPTWAQPSMRCDREQVDDIHPVRLVRGRSQQRSPSASTARIVDARCSSAQSVGPRRTTSQPSSEILPSDNSPNVRARALSRRHITGKGYFAEDGATSLNATIRGSVAQCRECPRGPNHRCAVIASRLTTFTQLSHRGIAPWCRQTGPPRPRAIAAALAFRAHR